MRFWVGFIDHEQAAERANDELLRIAHLVSVDQEHRLESVRLALTLLSRVPVLRGGDAASCSTLLEDLRTR